jgi:hypothetical protein
MIGHRSPRWRAVTWVLLFAFTLQSYVTQTHVHVTPHAIHHAVTVKLTADTPDRGKLPIGNDTTDCLFCQAIANAGAFFLPAPLPLPSPTLWAERAGRAIGTRAPHSEIAHSWQSRAPPRA